MRYISIDVETTGLDPQNCQILSIGAVIEDTNKQVPIEELPTFHGIIKRENISGSIFAINMNKDLIQAIKDYSTATTPELKASVEESFGAKFYHEDEIVEALFHFCYRNGLVAVPDTEGWSHMALSLNFKQVDGISYPVLSSNMPKVYLNCAGKNFAGFDKKFLEKLPRWKQVFSIRSRVLDPGILFVDWNNDDSVPGLGECKKRAGIEGIVTHNAVEDAMDVVMLFRKYINKNQDT
jgi:DNA polymerase III alpha subunit (gram-positive type)